MTALTPIDPFNGKPPPKAGDYVTIDRGDSWYVQPSEISGTVDDINGEAITIDGQIFAINELVDIYNHDAQ